MTTPALSPAQLITLKNDIAANTNQVLYQGNLTQINAIQNTADGNIVISNWYNQFADPAYYGWRSDVPIDDIYETITWANYTPADAADNTVTYQNRAIICQTKQMNLQLLLQGRSSLNAGKSNIRAGINDATDATIPSGAGGANRSGGWANILPILRRTIRNIEKLFAVLATGTGNNGGQPRGSTANPDLMIIEGTVTSTDIQNARNS